MPSRPRTVVIDGINYIAADVDSTAKLRLDLWRSRCKRAMAEVERLRGAITAHRQEKTKPGPTSVNYDDYKLWEVLANDKD